LPGGNWGEAGKFRLAAALWRQLSKFDPDVVLVPGYYTLPGIAAAMWAKAHGRVSVLMTESTAEDHTRSTLREGLKSGLIRSLFDWAVTGGTAHVQYLRELRFPADRVARFYDVVDNDGLSKRCLELRRDTTAAQHGLPPKYFLFVGRLAPEKNVTGLLREWISYRESGGNLPLVLAGDGPEAGTLQNIARESRFGEDVYFAGHKSSRDLLPYFSFATCLVLPSTREPWGLVVNEAMAAALPVVVSKRCGCAEDLVENGLNGLLFNPERQGELAGCLRSIEELSPNELRHMGEFSAERIVDYSPRNFGREIAAIAGLSHGARLRAEVAARTRSHAVSRSSLQNTPASHTNEEMNAERIV
jgi:glycosyltransferase involved in cell wall biosynthesis